MLPLLILSRAATIAMHRSLMYTQAALCRICTAVIGSDHKSAVFASSTYLHLANHFDTIATDVRRVCGTDAAASAFISICLSPTAILSRTYYLLKTAKRFRAMISEPRLIASIAGSVYGPDARTYSGEVYGVDGDKRKLRPEVAVASDGVGLSIVDVSLKLTTAVHFIDMENRFAQQVPLSLM